MANSRGSTTLVTLQGEIASELQKQIRQVLDKKGWELPSHCKEDKIAHLLRTSLQKLGGFYRQTDGPLWFFRDQNHRLYEVTTHTYSPFAKYITYITGQSSKTDLMRRSLDRLHAVMLEEATVVEVHGMAYNSHDLDVIALNDFGGGMWYRQRGGRWERQPNGNGGIFFWTPGDIVQQWVPEFEMNGAGGSEDSLQWFIQQPHFAEQGLTVHDQQLLLRALLLAPFFPSLNHTRPVSAHLGLSQDQQHDTGKTTAGKMIGVVWAGEGFEPTPVDSTNKGKESVAILLGQTPFVLLDNADTKTLWLNDFICTYATGGRMSARKLYSDQTLVHHEPKARLCVTSRKASFNREDVASRVIPFRFAPIGDAERKTEPELLGPVIARRGKIWAGILQAVAKLQDSYPSLIPPRPTARLADFDSFGWRVSHIYGEAEEWQGVIGRLKEAQGSFALEDESLALILEEMLKQGDLREKTTADFYAQLIETANRLTITSGLPGSAASCTTRILNIQMSLEAKLGIQITTRILHGQTRIEILRVHEEVGPSTKVTGVTGDLSL